ncbi:MAG: tRNA dihydrouridine synthase [Planctomycetota bacterium]|jgi:tRNA-dihydrouridine synthase
MNRHRLTLAPIRGITDAVYRSAFASHFGGFDSAMAPFIKLRQGHPLKASEIRQVEIDPRCPVIPQVITNSGERLAKALRELHGLGHEEVNLNLGCPSPMTAKRGRGAGLLPHPEKVDRILEAALKDAPIRLSVKLRLGYADPDECFQVLSILNRYPLSEVILHPRIATQMYDGVVDRERALRFAQACEHPFVFNGDMNSQDDAEEVMRLFPQAAGLMIGRGALRNPFLPQQIRGVNLPDPDGQRQRLRAFHDELAERYEAIQKGRAFFLRMREHWTYLSEIFEGSAKIRKRITKARDMGPYRTAVNQAFDAEFALTSHTA